MTVLLLLICFSIFAQETADDQGAINPVQTEPQMETVPAQAVPQQAAAPPAAPSAAQQTTANALQSFRIGRDLETRNRFDEANSYYNEAVRICLDELSRSSINMDAYTILTWTLLRQRRYSEVINWGDRALRVNPNDFRIVETMGSAYFYLNNFEHSLIMLQRYTASMPRGDRASSAFFIKGEIYRNQRKYHHADIAYTTAVALESRVFLWWYRLGMVREAAGDFAYAVEAYQTALDLNPGSREAAEALEAANRLLSAASR